MSFIDKINEEDKNSPIFSNCGVAGCYGKDEFGRDTLNGHLLPPKGDINLLPHEGGGKQGGDLPTPTPPKYDINYVNTAIFGAIGGGIGYLVAKNLIKTDKVLFPILIGAISLGYLLPNYTKKHPIFNIQ